VVTQSPQNSGVFLNEFLGSVDRLGHSFDRLLDNATCNALDSLGN